MLGTASGAWTGGGGRIGRIGRRRGLVGERVRSSGRIAACEVALKPGCQVVEKGHAGFVGNGLARGV